MATSRDKSSRTKKSKSCKANRSEGFTILSIGLTSILISGILLKSIFFVPDVNQTSYSTNQSNQQVLAIRVLVTENDKNKNVPTKTEKTSYTQDDVECLAKNIFHEARGTNTWEMMRVANVTMNRVKSAFYPKTVCSVVYQPAQFSWTLEKKKKYNKVETIYKSKAELKAFEEAKKISKRALAGSLPDLTNGALWYHTHKVSPKWKKSKEVTYASNWHNFYKSERK